MTHTHFIGIGGAGLSAIARVLLERGEKVTGSDRQQSPVTETLQAAGAQVFIGHNAENVQGADVVVRSSAVPDDNVEVVAAKEAGIPVLKRVNYVDQLLLNHFTIGVAGSHGKTTTTSMVAWLLHALGQQPGFIVGGEVRNLGTNAGAGKSRFFVVEADEYDFMFWGLNPGIALVTNVEHDHPDCFPTPESFEGAFKGFVDRITPEGTLVACMDDPGSAKLIDYAVQRGKQVKSYSQGNPVAGYTARGLNPIPGAGYQFQTVRGGEHLVEVALQVPGEHNVLNALGALAVIDLLELDMEKAAGALGEFLGTGRRFEVLGEAADVIVVDDYGHHPTEIKATLTAASSRYPDRRLWAVWQPHTYSRTRLMLKEFGQSFGDADRVIVTRIYAARETQPEDFYHQQILDAFPHDKAKLVNELDETANYLLESVEPGDVVIVFSAGDAVEVSAQLYAGLSQKELTSP